MPNFTVPYPQGLDFAVERLNNRLYPYIATLWGLDDSTDPKTYNCFPRVLRNKAVNSDGFIPEFFSPDANKYVDSKAQNVAGGIFFQDTIGAVSMYTLSDPIGKAQNGDTVARMQLIYFVRLDRVTPGAITDAQGQRLDEIAVNDVRNFISYNGCGFTVLDTFKDPDKVLEKFSGKRKDDTIRQDMQPFFCFRIDLETRFNPLIWDFVPPGAA